MKPIVGVLALLPLMQAYALAQEPTADAKEGKFYLEGGIGFGVMSMAAPATTKTGFDSEPEFAAGFAAEYGITDKFAAFTKLGVGVGLSDDPGLFGIGMTVDGAFKFIEKKGDVAALSAYAGLGFIHLNDDPKFGKSDSATDFVFEMGIQGDFGSSDTLSIQPFFQIQLVMGSRPFKGYNSVLQVEGGVKLLYKLSDQIFLEPSVSFTGGNFQDNVLFGVGIQVRL